MSLPEICENAKMAREYALLGNYDTSLVYYQGVIQQIQKHIQQLKDDAIMKQEWHQVRFCVDFHGIFSCLVHLSKYYYSTIPQYQPKFIVCPRVAFSQMLTKMMKNAVFIVSTALQVRQSIVKEYDQVKEINQTLANFKKDTVHFGGPRRSHEEEPTRDPDVWPAPTPVERDNRYTEMPYNHDYLIPLMVLCHCVYLESYFGMYQVSFKYL